VQQEEYAATDAFCDALQALDNELARMCVVTQSAEDEARQALSCTEQAFHRACDLLDHAHALQDQIRAAQMHQRLAERLLTRFTLTSDEMAIVQAPDAPVDDAFLGVMDRLQTILDESLLLMDVRDEDGETPAGSVQPSARAERRGDDDTVDMTEQRHPTGGGPFSLHARLHIPCMERRQCLPPRAGVNL